jgi:Tfp pilus assembly protein PilV
MTIVLISLKPRGRFPRCARGSTLLEAMFAVAIMSMVILALVTAQIAGMYEDQLVESKGGASDSSRRALQQFPTDVRGSKMWTIGFVTGTNLATFTSVSTNGTQQGNAIELFLTTNLSQYILYYYNSNTAVNSDEQLIRTSSTNLSQNIAPIILASNLIGGPCFTATDYNGNVQTNNQNSYKSIIHTTLQFCEFQYPLTAVGTNALYDYFRMDFQVTPHLPE